MEIRKLEYSFPKAMTEGDVFADDVNNVYPIGDENQVKASAKELRSEDFGIYDDKEKYLIVSRIVTEGEKLKIKNEIAADIKSFFGGSMEKYTQEQFDKMVASNKEESQKIFDAKLEEMKEAMKADINKDSEHQKLNDSIAEKDGVITVLETEKKELDDKIVAFNDKIAKLEIDIRNRDRMMKLVEAFEQVNIDKELKKAKIKSIASVTEDYEDDKFDEHVKSEVDFIGKTTAGVKNPDDLVEAGKEVPNTEGETKKLTARERIEKQIKKY